MSDHQVLWRNSNGILQGIIQSMIGLEYAFGEMTIGAMVIKLPSKVFSHTDFGQDHIFEIQRRVEGGVYKTVGERCFFLRDWTQNSEVLTLKAYDPVYVLEGRIVAYSAGSAYALKSGAADDIIKAVIRENMGSLSTDTDRQLSGLTVQDDASLGASVSVAFSRDNVLQAIQKVAGMSIQGGTYISFDMIYQSGTSLEFRTYAGQRGVNHGLSVNDRRVFSEKMKNLTDTVIEESRKDEKTYIYAGGKGEGDARAIGTASSDGLTNTRWSRREYFWDGRNTEDTTVLANEAASELYERRPKKTFSGKIQETQGSQFGVNYDYGDIVVMEGFGYSADARISTVKFTVDANGLETMDIKLRSEW